MPITSSAVGSHVPVVQDPLSCTVCHAAPIVGNDFGQLVLNTPTADASAMSSAVEEDRWV
jgi:hypothetical protein